MRGRGGWWFYAILAVVLAAAGYISNALSRAACQENAAFWFSHVLLAGQPYYVQLGPGQEGERRALDAAGVRYTPLGPDPDPEAYPRVTVATAAQIPFLVSVRFDWERGDRLRQGFTGHYLCVFGLVFSVGDSFDPEG
jgi:hypothetical protein